MEEIQKVNEISYTEEDLDLEVVDIEEEVDFVGDFIVNVWC